MSQAPFVQPPRIAVWFVDLFIPYEQAESIPGELLEEFSDLASKSGLVSARRWYWRQTAKTIVQRLPFLFANSGREPGPIEAVRFS